MVPVTIIRQPHIIIIIKFIITIVFRNCMPEVIRERGNAAVVHKNFSGAFSPNHHHCYPRWFLYFWFNIIFLEKYYTEMKFQRKVPKLGETFSIATRLKLLTFSLRFFCMKGQKRFWILNIRLWNMGPWDIKDDLNGRTDAENFKCWMMRRTVSLHSIGGRHTKDDWNFNI